MHSALYTLGISLLPLAASTAEGTVRFPAGWLARYEGEVVLDVAGASRVYDVRVLVMAGNAGEKPGSSARLFVARSLEERDGEDGPVALLDSFDLQAGRLVPVREHPAQETQGSREALDTFVPVELGPTFPVPEPGGESRATGEAIVFDQAAVEAPFRTAVEETDGGRRIVRELASGTGARFEFEESPATLASWREEYVVDSDDGWLKSLTRSVSFTVKTENGAEPRITSKVTLKAAATRPRTATEEELWARVRRELATVENHLSAYQPSEAVAPKVKALAKSLAASELSPLALATEKRLAAYRDAFENENNDSGRLLAKLLGRKAPEFMLRNLEGEKVSFRETTRGKVTLLAFWGYG